MLPLGFRRPHGTSYGVIEAPKLALGAAIHIAHANHDSMRLIVQVQAVGNQLLQFDIGRESAFKRSPAAARPAFVATATFWPPSTFPATAFTTATRTTIITARTTTLRTITARWTIPARLAAMAMLCHERFLLLRVAFGGFRFRLRFRGFQHLGQTRLAR